MSKNNSTTTDTFYISVANREGENISYQSVSSGEWTRLDGEKALSHSFLMDSFRKIMGRTLTLIDASIHDKQQNKAMKDIVRNIFSDEMEFAAQFAFDQEKLDKMANASYEEADPADIKSVTIEEALGVDTE